MGFAFQLFLAITASVACISMGKAVCSRLGKICEMLVNNLFDKIETKISKSGKAKGA